uniref:Uncharacterized protein n=1 Tax=Rhizophora mucronata TaxID=61149 RepID=A0A2P2LJV2_RHIMU
MRLLSIWVQ